MYRFGNESQDRRLLQLHVHVVIHNCEEEHTFYDTGILKDGACRDGIANDALLLGICPCFGEQAVGNKGKSENLPR